MMESINCINSTNKPLIGYQQDETHMMKKVEFTHNKFQRVEYTHNIFQQEENATSSLDSHNSTSSQGCSYNDENCYVHTYDTVALIAQTGGWVLLAAILCAVVFKLISGLINHMNGNDQADLNGAATNLNDNPEATQNTNDHDYMKVEQNI